MSTSAGYVSGVCVARLRWGLRLSWRPPRPAAFVVLQWFRFGFLCLSDFATTQNSPNTIRPQPSLCKAKWSIKILFYFILAGLVPRLYGVGRRIYKKCFCSVSFAPAASSYSEKNFRRQGSRVFLGSRGGWLYPTHPKQSLCSDFNLRASVACAQSLVFP